MSAARALTIGIDARAAVEVPAGRGRVVRELLRALAAREEAHSYLLYARRALERGGARRALSAGALIAARDPWWHVRAARAANRECDVFLSSNSYLTVWILRIPAVPIVYDMVAFDRADAPEPPLGGDRAAHAGARGAPLAGFVAISQATADAFDNASRPPRDGSRWRYWE